MIGKEVGNYKILKELGKGGMGVVYKAHQLSLGRMVAMKVLPRHLTNDVSFIKRFKNEARAIAKLNHPNIVQIYDIGQEDETHYYTMEFIEGPALDEIIYKEGFLSPERTIAIVSQVSKALQYAHGQGIVHRDIKPSNIMIAKSGRVKVTDFGLALQQRTTRLTVDGGIVGTPEYMSPEQAAGHTATAQSDVYSLGVVGYELLTGKVPFEGDSPLIVLNRIRDSEPQWPCSINPDIPPNVEKVIRRMMARNPQDRYASCQELMQDMQNVRTGQPISLQTERSSPLRILAAAAAVAALLVIVSGGGVLAYKIFFTVPPVPPPPPPIIAPPVIAVGDNNGGNAVGESKGGREIPPLPQLNGPGEMRQALAILGDELKSIRLLDIKSANSPAEAEFDIIKQGFALVRNRMRDFQDTMYPDELVLERGNTIRGKIIGESLQKIRLATPLGPQTIPRERVKKPIYATSEEKLAAEELLQIAGKVDILKKEVAAYERTLRVHKAEDAIEEESAEEVEDLKDRISEDELHEKPAPLEDDFAEDEFTEQLDNPEN